MKDAEIGALVGQNDRSKQMLIQGEAEREVLQAQLLAEQDKATAYQQTVDAQHEVIKEKTSAVEQSRQMAEQARRDSEENRRFADRAMANNRSGGSSGGGTATAEAPAATGGKYHLRIISLPKNGGNEKIAQEIAAFLETQSVSSVVPRSSGNFWVVDIGHFSSVRAPEAQALKEKIQDMKYEGVRQFKDPIFVTY